MTPPALPDPFQPFEQNQEFTADKPKFRWHKFLGCLRKYWWLPLVTLTLSCLAGGLYAWFLPASYSSVASLWSPAKLRLSDAAMFSEDNENFLGTQQDMLQNPLMHRLVINRLRAHENRIPVDKDGEPLEVKIRLSQNPKSTVFTILATGSDPAFTKSYLDAMIEAYLDRNKEMREHVTDTALSSINRAISKTDLDLKESQDVLNSFKRTNNLTILQLEASAAGQNLVNLKSQLSDLQLQDQLLQATMQDIRTNVENGKDNGSLPLNLDPALGSSSSYATAYQTLLNFKMERDKLSRYLRPKHPKMVKLEEQIERTKSLLQEYSRQNFDQRVLERQTISLKMVNITNLMTEWENKAIKNNSLIIDAEQLKANVQRYKDMYDKLQLMVQNVSIGRSIDQETLDVLNPASDSFHSYDKVKSVAEMSVIAGLGLGFGLILLLSIKDDRFNTVIEFNERLGDTVIGQIPDVQVIGNKKLLLLEEGENQYMLAESYRNLRSALLFMAVNGARPKTILITSALPNEGKSTVAANLAQALALCGSQVVLIDCDLRKGVVHERMGVQREPGITELLRGKVVLEQVIQIGSVANLSFIARGKSTGESADLFLGVKFAQVLAWLRDQFDYVLIDSSPVLATDEATTLAPMVDGTLMVVRGNFTGGKQVNEAMDQLYQRQAKILGVVFNRANSSSRSYQYYKYKEYQPVKEV